MDKTILNPVFEAWYDHKMDPEDLDLLTQHRNTMDRMASTLSKETGTNLDRYDLMKALGSRFGQWMKENGLPSPSKK